MKLEFLLPVGTHCQYWWREPPGARWWQRNVTDLTCEAPATVLMVSLPFGRMACSPLRLCENHATAMSGDGWERIAV